MLKLQMILKEELINSMNPEWGDLSINWLDDNFKFRNKK